MIHIAKIAGCAAMAGLLFAQTPASPAFEVATIRPSQPDTPGPLIGISAGRLTLTSFTLREMMVFAYWIHPSQVLGAAGWMESDKYDVVAKPEGSSQVPEEELREMLQALLADRFQLKLHHEMKELPAYVFVLGKNGSKMKARTPGDGGPGFRLVFQGARLPGRNASIAQLAFVLQAVVLDRPVLDKTGLTGNFDFDLAWTPNETQFGGKGATMPADPDSPDIFTAVQEQLGLRLESQKDPVDVLAIDHAEKPSAN
jgi:bla regulator protein blaR1